MLYLEMSSFVYDSILSASQVIEHSKLMNVQKLVLANEEVPNDGTGLVVDIKLSRCCELDISVSRYFRI